jgi:hypothetical protein
MNYRIPYIVLLIFGFFFVKSTIAQNNTVKINAAFDHEIGFELDVNSASSLNNALLNASGFIDNDLKDENLLRLNDLNQGGTNADFKLFYRQDRPELWGIKNLGFYFALEWHYLDENRFTKDLYSLILYGNKDFAGKTADLSYSARQQVNYYQLKAGLRKTSQNEKHQFGINGALVLGNKLSVFQLDDKSCFYTSPLGDELSLRTDLEYMASDTARSEWYQTNGVGASVDLFYKYQKKDVFSIIASVENFGFIHWNKNTLNLTENKKHIFSGVEVDNIFDIPDPLIQSSDTLNDYLDANTNKEANSTYNPIDFKLRYIQYFMSKKIEMSALVHYRMFSFMWPLYQLDATYKINDNIKLGPILSYGGYTAFNAGLKLEFSFAKNYQLKLESRYITGFAQHSFSGMGGFINFTYKI